ncbi:MAG: FtsW/RodA/SpoVE family cell cycle protein [Candidatus Bruticola sp.]
MFNNSSRLSALLMLIITAILAYGSYILTLLTPSESGLEAGEPFKYALLIAISGWIAWAAVTLRKKQGDVLLIPCALFLVSISWLEIYSLGFRTKIYNQGPRQAVFTALALACFVLMTWAFKNYRLFEEYKYMFLCSGLVLQTSVMIFGAQINGARLWFKIGGFSLQPGEFVKILFIIFFAAYLRQFRSWIRLGFMSDSGVLARKALLKLGVAMAIAELILVAQRDLGSALLLFGIFVAMFYIATGRRDIIFLTALLSSGGAYFCWKIFSHVQIRVANWLEPFKDIDNSGYQMCMALFSLSNAGFDGTGLGMGLADTIPEVSNDFAFIAITEEFGLIGCTALILGLVILVSRCFAAALKTQNEFGAILASGLASMFAWQSAIIMLGDTKIIPMTGITLPFVSAGGSSLISSFVVLAMVWAVGADSAENNRSSEIGKNDILADDGNK